MIPVAVLLFLLAATVIGGLWFVRADLRQPMALHWGPVSCLQLTAQMAAAAVLVFLAAPAMAAEADAYAIDLRPLIAMALDYVFAAAVPVAAWLVKRLLDWLKLSNDARVRAFLDDLCFRGLSWAHEQALRTGSKVDQVEVRQRIVADALGYVTTSGPGALKHFGLTPERLQQMLEARLAEAQPIGSAISPDAAAAIRREVYGVGA